MLDIRYIRQNVDLIKAGAAKKGIECDIDRLCRIDDRRRAIQLELDQLKQQQNETGANIALYRNPKSEFYKRKLAEGCTPEQLKAESEKLVERMAAIKARVRELEDEQKPVLEEFNALMLTVPMPPGDDVPVGPDESANVELYRVGEPPKFDFKPKDHAELGAMHGLIDIDRGVKLSGSRSYFLTGAGALLHQAVLRMAFDYMVYEQGFTPMSVPVLVREEVMVGTGFFPAGREQAYYMPADDLYLTGTAEVALTSYHKDEILAEDELPKRYVAWSTCFRREAGTYGKDTAGIYRIHQFDKIEQVVVCRADVEESKAWQKKMLSYSEELLRRLELPYRVVHLCTGDIGPKNASTFDIETWMPSRGGYGETHSASRLYDFQARRLNIRYRDKDKKVHVCHTLNNTVVASPRILIPILECNQNKDGSITIPKALRPHMHGMERIGG
ncbi:MAG: serine--tRNA ligase [Phycisphaerae bacterium]